MEEAVAGPITAIQEQMRQLEKKMQSMQADQAATSVPAREGDRYPGPRHVGNRPADPSGLHGRGWPLAGDGVVVLAVG